MKQFIGYTRISDPKQGKGVSLEEQRDAILRCAIREGGEIAQWFEERQTAAKKGRVFFNKILKLLKQRKADGLIVHKIDRSARNLGDWAALGDLIDTGVEVHFAHEGLDMHTRGGRLSADLQAVVAADYIRNLREEARKGFYGRIKQGIFPLPAPLGYLDMGAGKPKELDPAKAPLVKRMFELYSTRRYSLDTLLEEMFRLGLRNRRAGKVTRPGASVLLNNPFYIGLIRLKRTGETFPGAHQPLITKSLFDRVQGVLRGKTNARPYRHDLVYRRMIACKGCGYSLIGEIQKGRTYYRCHTKSCPTKSLLEKTADGAISAKFQALVFSEDERVELRRELPRLTEDWHQDRNGEISNMKLTLNQLHNRLARLTDAFIDKTIEKSLFEERKTDLLMSRKDTEAKLASLQKENASVPNRLSEFLELAESVDLLHKSAVPEEKRDLLRIVTSNRSSDGKNVDITLSLPFSEVANRNKNTNSGPYRNIPRTINAMLSRLVKWFVKNPDHEILEYAHEFCLKSKPSKTVMRGKDGKFAVR